MSKLIPAIITGSYPELTEKVQLASRFVNHVHLDVMDGTCTASASWPYSSRKDITFEEILAEKVGLPAWDMVDYEVHLMLRNPKEAIEQWFRAGAARIIVHADFDINPKVCELYVGSVTSFSVAILPSTPIEKLEPWMQYADRIQVMGNDHIGEHGIPLDESVYKKVEEIKAKYPNKELSIDIGVQEHTWQKLVDSGIQYLVAASWFWNADDKASIVHEIQEYKVG